MRPSRPTAADRRRRAEVDDAIDAGHRQVPPADEEAWPDEATTRMIAEEPW